MSNAVVRNYLSLITFSHTIFALPFAICGFFMALRSGNYELDALLLLKVILCMVFARSAAMAFNRYIDRDFDKLNARTAGREIPAGKISPSAALSFVILSAAGFVVTTWFINPLCFYLSPVALAVILGYSYTKRFTWLCHVVLGIGLALAPLGAWLAITGEFALLPVLLSLVVLFWVSGFDIIYALQDEEFDKSLSLNSIPVKLGKANSLRLSKVFHVCAASFLFIAGILGGYGIFFWLGFAVFTGLLIYQHSIVSPTDLSRVNMAFGTTNGIASLLFCLFFVADFYLGGVL